MKKRDLISALENSQKDIQDQLASFSEQEMIELTTADGWSVKDILAHLTRWEAELIKLLWQLSQGQRPITVHFTGPTVDEVNDRWLAEDRTRPLERILEDFRGVRRQTIRRVESFTDTELSDTQRYSWLEGKSLSEWVAEDTFRHEAEHLPQIEELISIRK
jgi:hypothetical protein